MRTYELGDKQAERSVHLESQNSLNMCIVRDNSHTLQLIIIFAHELLSLTLLMIFILMVLRGA